MVMNKRNYKWIAIILGLSLLIGSVAVLVNQNTLMAKTNGEIEEEDTLETSAINLFEDTNTWKEIHINDSLLLKKDSDGNWNGVELDREQDDEKIANAITIISSLQALQDDSVKKEDIGLDQPSITIELLDDTDSTLTATIGNISNNEQTYYAALSDSDQVYQVPLAAVEQIPLTGHDVTDNAITTIKTDAVRQMTIFNGIQKIELKPTSSYTEEEARTNLSGWFMYQPYSGVKNVQYSKMEAMLYGVDSLELEKVVAESTDDYAQYGLDDVDFTITLESNDKRDTLMIGSPADANNYYAKMENNDQVFTVSKETLEPYSYQAYDLVDHYVKIIALDVLSEIRVRSGDDEIVMEITEDNSTSSDDSRVKSLSFAINNKQIDDDTFRDLYKKIAGLSVTDEVTNADYQQPEATITYNLNLASNQSKEVKVEFVPYDEEHFAAFVDGTADFLIDKASVKEMISEIHKVEDEV